MRTIHVTIHNDTGVLLDRIYLELPDDCTAVEVSPVRPGTGRVVISEGKRAVIGLEEKS